MVLNPGEAELPEQQALAAGFFSQRISVIAVEQSIIACEQAAIGLQLAEIDPVILALEIMDHVAQAGDDVEFLAVARRDVSDRKAIRTGERRVGKEWGRTSRTWWWTEQLKEKKWNKG